MFVITFLDVMFVKDTCNGKKLLTERGITSTFAMWLNNYLRNEKRFKGYWYSCKA